MRILITGAAGQVGTELVARAGDQAIGVDRTQLDISDEAAVLRLLQTHKPAIVINAAAYTAVDKAEQEPERAYAVNRDGARHLAMACSAIGIPLLHISTDYVFDGSKSTPYLETDPTSPAGIYARSKCEGDEQIRAHLPEHLILRVSWVFGIQGNNFAKTILRLAGERSELRIIADQHGCPTEAGAIADTLLDLAQRFIRDNALPWGTYHYTGAPETTWHGFAKEIVDQALALGMISKAPLVHAITTAEYPLPAPRPANSLLDGTQAEQVLGLVRQDWRQGLQHVLQNLKSKNA